MKISLKELKTIIKNIIEESSYNDHSSENYDFSSEVESPEVERKTSRSLKTQEKPGVTSIVIQKILDKIKEEIKKGKNLISLSNDEKLIEDIFYGLSLDTHYRMFPFHHNFIEDFKTPIKNVITSAQMGDYLSLKDFKTTQDASNKIVKAFSKISKDILKKFGADKEVDLVERFKNFLEGFTNEEIEKNYKLENFWGYYQQRFFNFRFGEISKVLKRMEEIKEYIQNPDEVLIDHPHFDPELQGQYGRFKNSFLTGLDSFIDEYNKGWNELGMRKKSR